MICIWHLYEICCHWPSVLSTENIKTSYQMPISWDVTMELIGSMVFGKWHVDTVKDKHLGINRVHWSSNLMIPVIPSLFSIHFWTKDSCAQALALPSFARKERKSWGTSYRVLLKSKDPTFTTDSAAWFETINVGMVAFFLRIVSFLVNTRSFQISRTFLWFTWLLVTFSCTVLWNIYYVIYM